MDKLAYAVGAVDYLARINYDRLRADRVTREGLGKRDGPVSV